MSSKPIVYILYNADASVAGKLGYAYRKITASAGQSPCVACDLFHGELAPTETEEWTATKKKIGAEVKQLHRDEIDQEIKDFVTLQKLRYPLILGRSDESGSLELLMEAKDVQGCNKDHGEFLVELAAKAAEKGIPLEIAK